MKIRVRDIKEIGLVVEKEIDPSDVGLNDNEIKCITPLSVKGTIERVGFENVIAKLKTSGKFSFECSRCLVPIEKDIDNDFILNFDIDPHTEEVDLIEDIRQEIIIDFPSFVVCKKECSGLCPDCGSNLNTEECKCKKEQKSTKAQEQKS